MDQRVTLTMYPREAKLVLDQLKARLFHVEGADRDQLARTVIRLKSMVEIRHVQITVLEVKTREGSK